MTTSELIAINGTVMPIGEARISPLDRGLLYGDGVFETLRTYDGEPAFLSRHLRRMSEAADTLRIPWSPDEAQIHGLIRQLADANELGEATVRITLTRGPTPAGLGLDGAEQRTWIVRTTPLRQYAKELYEKGMRLHTSAIRRNASSPVPRLKTLNFLECLLARDEATHAGADEALFLNTRGDLAEGSVSNLFLVEGGRVLTPSIDSGILPGITREVVLHICQREGIAASETRVATERLQEADEVFLTNSLMEVMPVSAIDDAGFAAPGVVTQALRRRYRELCASP